MKETFLFILTPMVASILLAGMLGYFGTHILTRGIIFIDIAIAQIAALGTMIGLLLGFAEESFSVQLISYVFTLLVIGSFAFIRTRNLFVPMEAIIGIVYCIGLALALLLAEHIPGGSNYITKAISGNILWVTWDKVLQSGLLFMGIGLVHTLLRKQFIYLSEHGTVESGHRIRFSMLNLLFYITFGIVVVKTVMIGGVFVVFTLLIAPATMAAMFFREWKQKLIWSWVIGITASVCGILLSYSLNISNGPAIVCLLGCLVFVMAIMKLLIPKPSVKSNKNSNRPI